MDKIRVAATVIRNNGKVLIAQRPASYHMGLKWEFPGGKIEPGEDVAACLKREIREELALQIDVGQEIMVVKHEYPDRKVILHCHWCNYVHGEAKTLECQAFKWVTAGEIKHYDFADADRPVVDFLTGHI